VARSDFRAEALDCLGPCHRYEDAEVFDSPPPTGLETLPDPFETEVGTRTIPAPFVSTVADVDLLGLWGLAVTPGNRYVVEQAEGSLRRLSDTLVMTVGEGLAPVHRGPAHASTTLSSPTVSFVGRFDTEFFHWFTDHLPRVLGIEAYRRQTGVAPQILLPPDPPAWLTDSLAWVGVDRDRWVTHPGGRVHVEELVVPAMRRHAYDDDQDGWSIVSPRSLRILRDRMRTAVDVTPAASERVYISRADASERQVVNEAEVVETLAQRGFERYLLSELSLAEQVRLLAHASVVVGPHGAGLTNMIYGDDLDVVELFGETVNPCYYSIAAGLGFDYGYLCCDPTEDGMRVDVEDLAAVLDAVGD